MNSSLTISIYRRAGRQASLVFRRGNKVLYRITTVEHAQAVVRVFGGYEADLKKNEAEPEFVFEILCPRKRNRAVEIGLDGGRAHLYVYELVSGELSPCFRWNGSRDELFEALGQLSLMAFINRY
ncbi:hypothetical protein [Pedobacter ginsengisoli]|uniref:hypothetical protein n=1 Tax=Pedobacter ginsengisoli TaxID=363852 RepID=UPI00254BC626|nr:hypothetical protein [Pedobacter ginsengisoli]